MVIVLDLETKKDFREVGGRKKLELLGVSVVGIYDYTDNQYKSFEEHRLHDLENILTSAALIIGFNIKEFDFLVLQSYLKRINFNSVSALDIMEDITRYAGYRVSLDSVAQATLKESKSGDGLMALRLFNEGKLDELKQYCLNDVRLTKEIYEFGLKNNFILIKSRDGLLDHKVPINWHQKTETKRLNQLF